MSFTRPDSELNMVDLSFDSLFSLLLFGSTDQSPFPWQRALYEQFVAGRFPPALSLPTGSGKTSLMAVWLLALAEAPERVPRRLVWVVNRRVVVDQATAEAEKMRRHLAMAPDVCRRLREMTAGVHQEALAISTLRGEFADNQEWSQDASRPAVIVGTVDMIGSRLLFSGYGDSFRARPKHAGLLGHDALLVNDEAHLTPAFANLLTAVEERVRRAGPLRPFHTIRVSATQGSQPPFPPSLDVDLEASAVFAARWNAVKRLHLCEEQDEKEMDRRLVSLACERSAGRTVVFVRSPRKAQKIAAAIRTRTRSPRVCVLAGTLRGWERDQLAGKLDQWGFSSREIPEEPCWLVSTSAGEVGINISSDRLITDLESADHLLQRFGRLNRFGETHGEAFLVFTLNGKMPENHARTLEYLRQLPCVGADTYDVSPAALFGHPPPADAYEEEPPQPSLQDWHLDLWAQTSIRHIDVRPDVEPWLHGRQSDYPETEVVWRTEVEDLTREEVSDEDRASYLKYCPILAHERLRLPTHELTKILSGLSTSSRALLVRSDGTVEAVSLPGENGRRLAYATLLLPPGVAAVEDGMLAPSALGRVQYDVAHLGKAGVRWRHAPEPGFDKLACEITLDTGEFSDDTATLCIYVPAKPVPEKDSRLMLLDEHTAEVARYAGRLGELLRLPEDVTNALVEAARRHDLGKADPVWQAFAGNTNGDPPLAKPRPGCRINPKLLGGYRHEFHSVRQSEDAGELVRHLIASHHGWARPHFPERAYDKKSLRDSREQCLNAARRFARLTGRYGHWGLAYLEAVFRTADALASRACEEDADA